MDLVILILLKMTWAYQYYLMLAADLVVLLDALQFQATTLFHNL